MINLYNLLKLLSLGLKFRQKMKQHLYAKVAGYNLQEVLIVLVIIGILLLLALPNLMPLIGKAKSTEAQLQLNHIYNSQTTYRYMYSKYSTDFSDIDFEAPKTVNENGMSNYQYEILSASNNSFKARATAITDFDGDGTFNVWEIDQTGKPVQKIKD